MQIVWHCAEYRKKTLRTSFATGRRIQLREGQSMVEKYGSLRKKHDLSSLIVVVEIYREEYYLITTYERT